MNNSTKVAAILAELRNNERDLGPVPTDDFTKLCQYVTDWMISRYDLRNADSINWGYCFIWAYLVWALWPNQNEVTFKTCTGHVVVKYGNRYYDSEHVDGDSRLHLFCAFESRGSDGVKHVDAHWMCWYWTRAGKQLREFRRLVRKTNPKLYKFARAFAADHWDDPFDSFYGYQHITKLPEVA